MTFHLFFRRLTISDGIERCLKRGRGAEQAAAAQLAPLMCVQLGVGDYSEELCRELAPVLMLVARDPSVSPLARSKVSKNLQSKELTFFSSVLLVCVLMLDFFDPVNCSVAGHWAYCPSLLVERCRMSWSA